MECCLIAILLSVDLALNFFLSVIRLKDHLLPAQTDLSHYFKQLQGCISKYGYTIACLFNHFSLWTYGLFFKIVPCICYYQRHFVAHKILLLLILLVLRTPTFILKERTPRPGASSNLEDTLFSHCTYNRSFCHPLTAFPGPAAIQLPWLREIADFA